VTDSLTIVFENEVPNMKTSTNAKSRLHWTVKGKVVSDDRERWGWLWKVEYGNGLWFLRNEPPYIFDWTVRWKDKRNRDPDNVISALKSATDSMVELGYLEDDRATIIRKVSLEQEFGSSEPGTELIISRAG
jgi:Holliday junction resolvase RusA-like endonuclease